jgi:hypothetical protein
MSTDKNEVSEMEMMDLEEGVMEDDVPEDTQADYPEVAKENPAEKEDSITLSRAEFEALREDVAEIRRENRELKSQVSSRTKMSKRARQEAAHLRCRVSDHYRDLLAEHREYKSNGVTKQIVLPRSFQIEKEAFANGRFAPCAPNGGMYYVRNKSWQASPRTGLMRSPILFNRHLYVDYTIKGNEAEALREDYELCNIHGVPVKPFSSSLPIEDLEAIRKAGKARNPDIIDALDKLKGGSL